MNTSEYPIVVGPPRGGPTCFSARSRLPRTKFRTPRDRSVPQCDAVLARLAAADQHVVAHEHGLSAAERSGGRIADGTVPPARERGREPVERLLEGERPRVAAVAVEPPAGLVERGLRVEAAIDDVRDELQVAWGCMCPPIRPNGPSSAPSRSSMPGMIVWYGRLPAASRLGCPGSSVKQAPRF